MKLEKKVFVTSEGMKRLKSEYKELINNKRPFIAKKIKKAREHGDVSENAEYDAAREEQAFIEGRIQELEEILRDCEVVKENVKPNGIVSVGSKVRVHLDGVEEKYYIVGAPEANPLEGKISHESPLGKALLGKKAGDKVEFQAPVGKLLLHWMN